MSPNTRSSVRVRLGFGRSGSKTGGILSPEDVEDTAQKAGNEGRTTQKAGDAGETALGAGDVNRATWKGQLSIDQTGRSAQEDGLEAVMAGSQVGQTTEEPSWRCRRDRDIRRLWGWSPTPLRPQQGLQKGLRRTRER